jgi:WD40 repeat protein
MLRTLLLLSFLGLVGYGFYSWATGGIEVLPGGKKDQHRDNGKKDLNQDRDHNQGHEVDPPVPDTRGGNHQESDSAKPVRVGSNGALEPLVIPDGRIGIIDFADLSAQRPGRILVLGVEVPSDAAFDPVTMRREKVSFLAIETSEADWKKLNEKRDEKQKVPAYQVPGDNRLWRRWQETDPIEPGKVKLMSETKTFRLLQENTPVRYDQLLGVIDPRLTHAEMDIKVAKLLSAQAEVYSAVKTRDEAKTRYDRTLRLYRANNSSDEELAGAKLTWERYVEEEKAKQAALEVARREVSQTDTVLRLHEIRSPLNGVVRRMLKRTGESVKETDLAVLRIENLDRLSVEAFVDVQDAQRLAVGTKVVVEPAKPESPAVVLRGHREAVTAVAVSRAPQSYIISAGEDRTVRIWNVIRALGDGGLKAWTGEELWRLDHPSVVRSLACTSKEAKQNLFLTGASDGHAWMWDLDQLDKTKPIELKEAHRGAIFATAFSSDGQWCATGSDDRSMCLWNTKDGSLVQRVNSAHKGAVTSLFFAGKDQIISAGRDYRMAVWSIKDGKVSLLREIDQRAGHVEQLGVNRGGTQVLFDQGNQLSILNPSDWTKRAPIRNLSSAANFTTFALFGPEDRTVLTAGAADNRLQLWSNPVNSPRRRAVELRQYVWNDGPSTCAAFDPQGAFAVTGTRDRQVLVWQMPPTEEVREPEANAVVRSIVEVFENSSRQYRVIVDVDDVKKKIDRLVPGDKASLVIYPK